VKKYTLDFTEKAKYHIRKLKKSGDKSIINKLNDLFEELREHPSTGRGKPEFLKHLKY